MKKFVQDKSEAYAITVNIFAFFAVIMLSILMSACLIGSAHAPSLNETID